MEISAVYNEARKKLVGVCRVCRVCDGKACAGKVPGVGGIGTGNSFKRNVKSLAKHGLNLRVMHDISEPVLHLDLFGNKLKMPVLGAAIGGGKINYNNAISDNELNDAFIEGCYEAGTIGQSGDGPYLDMFKYGIETIRRNKGWGIPIIKPREQDEIILRMRLAEEAGCMAVGIDIDAAGLINMRMMGQRVEPKTVDQLRELVQSTSLPVIIKGVMTPDEAEKAVLSGAKGIVVSNHGGRVLDWTPGTAEVLPEIAHRVKGHVYVLIDGGIRTGYDVLKCLALGADAVMIGRPLAVAAIGGGTRGVRLVLEQLYYELYLAMIMTGTAAANDVSPGILVPLGI